MRMIVARVFGALGLYALFLCPAALAQKISALPAATALGGTEKMAGIQGSGCATQTAPCVTVAVSAAQLATLANATAQPLDSDLTAIAALTTTTYGRSLLTQADAAATRSTIGLGTMATQGAGAVAITGGTVTGITDLAVADGGTGSSTASAARTALGLAIGTDVQAHDTDLDAIAALATTSYGRSVLTQASAATLQASLSLTSYVAGGYYFPDGLGVPVSPSASASNVVYFHPFILLAPIGIDALVARVTTAAASGNFNFMLYAADAATKLPTGAALYCGASQSTGSVATIEDTAPNLSLAAGVYWAATNKDTTAATAVFFVASLASFATAQRIPAQSASGLMTGSGSSFSGYAKSFTYGSASCPTMTGNYATDGLSHVLSNILPVVGFKAQ